MAWLKMIQNAISKQPVQPTTRGLLSSALTKAPSAGAASVTRGILPQVQSVMNNASQNFIPVPQNIGAAPSSPVVPTPASTGILPAIGNVGTTFPIAPSMGLVPQVQTALPSAGNFNNVQGRGLLGLFGQGRMRSQSPQADNFSSYQGLARNLSRFRRF